MAIGGTPDTSVAAAADLHQKVLDPYQAEYKDLFDAWKNIETKAQGAATTSGIFLAAAFAFAREFDPTTALVLKVLLASSVLALAAS